MQTVIHSLSQLPLGFWGTIFAFLSFLLIVLLFFVVNNRTRSRDVVNSMGGPPYFLPRSWRRI